MRLLKIRFLDQTLKRQSLDGWLAVWVGGLGAELLFHLLFPGQKEIEILFLFKVQVSTF